MKLNSEQVKLVEENVNLAYSVAHKYLSRNYRLVSNKGIDLDDLVQVALEQLCKSVKTYDPSKAKSSTYFHNNMYLKINTFVKTFNQVKIPRFDLWIDKEDDKPKDSLFNILFGDVVSFDKPITESENLFLGDVLGENDNSFESVEANLLLEDILNGEELYLLESILQGKTQMAIGQEIRKSQAQISRSFKIVKEKLKRELIGEVV